MQRNISIFHAFADVLEGDGGFRNVSDPMRVVGLEGTPPPDEIREQLADVVRQGDEVTVRAGEAGIRFLLVSGRPLQEPVAWRGPIVMNTNEELQQAFPELRAGTFIQDR